MTADEPDGAALVVRAYGTRGPRVVVLHGGPGAPGGMAPVARELADALRVLEPLQRSSGGEPLTVARHVEDLHGVIRSHCGPERPALVGHSWGAMLALAYAADHPGAAASLALVGCGTFDKAARRRLEETRASRLSDDVKRRVRRLAEESDAGAAEAIHQLTSVADNYDLIETPEDPPGQEIPFDARACRETWDDMVRLQEEGVYPAAFARIRAPAVMLHGAYDPHPGRMIFDGLRPFLPHLEYREWERCGHEPWRERAARAGFFAALREWLARHSGG